MGKRVAVGAGTALGASVLFAPNAQAATFTVTNTDSSGDGSLAQEVFEAKSAPGDDVVVFQAGLSGTIQLAGPDSDIEINGDSLEIQGPGADQITVQGAGDDRIFHLYSFGPGESVSISGLTLTGGSSGGPGGAIRMYEAGGDAAALTISDAVLTGNSGAHGGAVAIDGGSLAITRSVISDNEAGGGGGGLYAADTAGEQPVEVSISDSVITGNSAAGNGGGGLRLYRSDGGVLIERSLVVGNSTAFYGGGIVLYGEDIGEVTIDATTVSNNSADGGGGGIELFSTGGPVVVQNSTISGNLADADGAPSAVAYGYGGGIASLNSGDRPRTIRNSTIVGNTAYEGGGIYRFAEDDPAEGDDVIALVSSIVAGNAAVQGFDLGQSDPPDPADGAFAIGFSLIGSTADATVVETPAGTNLIGADPQLGPLAPNGGPTPTLLPAPTSPVLDAGIAGGLATDQRGLPRTVDLAGIGSPPGSDATDIGAVELTAPEARINCQGEELALISGTDGDDRLVGGDGPDAIFGMGGDDRIAGRGGRDCLNGGGGKDRLRGGAGKDQLKGRAGRDKVKGQAGNDKLRGQGGNDKLDGGAGKDRLAGGAGKDTLRGGPGRDKLKGNSARDRIIGGGGRDEINCGGGRDLVIAGPKDDVSRNCERVVEVG